MHLIIYLYFVLSQLNGLNLYFMPSCNVNFFHDLSLNMYVEDRTSYNGPVQVSVKPTFTLAELKEQVQCEFEIPVDVQRWILGKSLAEDDQSTLASHGKTPTDGRASG